MRPIQANNGSRHAITDLYDEQRRTFLIQYPVWLIVVLGLTGVAAFAITGFFGHTGIYATKPAIAVDQPFTQPWLLFLWFCAVLLTLQVSIFRHASLRRRLIATLIVSVIAITFIGITYFSQSLPDFLKQLLQGGRFFRFLATNAVTYAILNFGLIAIFWVDTIRRWIRRARGLPPNPRVDLGIEGSAPARPEDMPTLQELISGDLIAGAVFVLLLALLFRLDVVQTLIHPHGLQPGQINECTVSWPVGCTLPGGGAHNPPTLTFIDVIQSLIYLPLGLILLALTATISGLGAVGGVNETQTEAEVPARASADESSTVPIAVDVTQTLINTLKSALDRRLRLLLNNLALSLRMIGWPALIFVATYGLAALSTEVQSYLHSDRAPINLLEHVLPAIGWGVAALFAIIFSAALMIFRWRVAENTLRFVGLIGFVLLLTFWIFSGALTVFNVLLQQTNALERSPFTPPSSPTYISLAALLIFGSLLILRRSRGRRAADRPSPAAAPIPDSVHAGTFSVRSGTDPSATQVTNTTTETPPTPPQG